MHLKKFGSVWERYLFTPSLRFFSLGSDQSPDRKSYYTRHSSSVAYHYHIQRLHGRFFLRKKTRSKAKTNPGGRYSEYINELK